MIYKLENLKKIHEFEYTLNSSKKRQIKPIFLDLKNNEEWVGKTHNRIYSANERIGYDLSQIINLTDINVPEINYGLYEGENWCLSKKIDVKYHFRKQEYFSELNQNEAQALILNRLMCNVDGNMANLLKDFNDNFWLIDFEYSGNFKNFNERFLINNKSRAKSILLAYMGYDRKHKSYFDKGIESVAKAVDSKKLSVEHLTEVGLNAGLNLDESKHYANNLMHNAINIEKNMHLIIDVWNEVFQEKNRRASYKELVVSKGARCGQACIKMAEKYFGKKDKSFQELDEILSVNKKRQFIFPVQIAKYFAERGHNIDFFIDEKKAKKFLENPKELIVEKFGSVVGAEIFKNSNIDVIQFDLNWILNNGFAKKEVPSLSYIMEQDNKDSAIISTVNMGLIYSSNFFIGHHIFLTGFNNKFVFYNDPGPKNAKKNEKVKITTLLKSVESASLFDYGHIIIK